MPKSQSDLQLFFTKAIIRSFTSGLDFHTNQELKRLLPIVAKKEWGPETIIDDFSIEGKYIIKNGLKEEII